ncbi:ERCC4 protein, partial [Haematococcus lacustris]
MAAHAEGLADGATAPAPAETAFWRSTMARLLPYEQTLVGELIEEDALCILAAGLGWQRMVAVIIRLHHYHQAGVLLVLGAQPWQREAVCAELQRHDPEVTCPVDINSEVQAPERLALYRSRAAAFVTPRILTVDLLSARLQPREIAGMIVLNAHRVTATSGEGFAVRLYRAGNSSGFLRALSDAPAAFMGGFNKVEKVMRALHVRRLRLWPRFQQEVQAAMEASPPQVEECLQELPASVQLIQAAILEVIESLLKELRRANKVDCSELTLESLALHKAFDDVVRRQLDPVWHTLSWRSRQIVKDLKTLRAIAQYLIQYDAVTFLAFLE